MSNLDDVLLKLAGPILEGKDWDTFYGSLQKHVSSLPDDKLHAYAAKLREKASKYPDVPEYYATNEVPHLRKKRVSDNRRNAYEVTHMAHKRARLEAAKRGQEIPDLPDPIARPARSWLSNPTKQGLPPRGLLPGKTKNWKELIRGSRVLRRGIGSLNIKTSSVMWEAMLDEFEKVAGSDNWHHVAELVGLGTLALPTIQEMRGEKMSEGASHAAELGGLGILAAPSIHSLLKRRR